VFVLAEGSEGAKGQANCFLKVENEDILVATIVPLIARGWGGNILT
jgi:hypothetical protein